MHSTVDPARDQQRLATWSRRLAALAIDTVILATTITVTVLAAGMPAEELNDRIRNRETLIILLLFVVPEAIYTTALVGSLNQTFGKMALGIKVVDAENRSPIGYTRAFTRWLSTAFLWILWVPGIVDHLWPLRDGRNQTFHDKFARSVVVRT